MVFVVLIIGLIVGASAGFAGRRLLRVRRQRLETDDYAALAALYIIRRRLEGARMRAAIRCDGAQVRRELRRALDGASDRRRSERP